MAVMITPITVTASAAPRTPPTAWPASMASNAAMPPSMDTIGMTTPICPRRSEWYMSSSPPTLPAPPKNSHRTDVAEMWALPEKGTTRVSASSPNNITQARVNIEPIARAARDAKVVPMDHRRAAPRPPRTAVTKRARQGPPLGPGRQNHLHRLVALGQLEALLGPLERQTV